MARTRLKTPFADFLPPLSTQEREALRASIEAEGVKDPVWIDDEGNVLDGHNRLEIDPKAPTRVAEGLTPAEKKAFVYKANFERRNLSPEQKREVDKAKKQIAFELREEDPKKNTQAVVARLLGVAQCTVASWFSTNIIGNNATRQPDARLKLSKEDKAEIVDRCEAGDSQAQIAADFGVSQKTVSNVYRQWQGQQEAIISRQAKAKDIEDALGKDDHGVRIGDFRTIAKELPNESVPLIFTDPPYDRETLSLYGDLGQIAARVLQPGGSLICYLGQYQIAEVCQLVGRHLRLWWTLACVHTGQSARMTEYGVVVKWKPLLWFVKDTRGDKHTFIDDLVQSERQKDSHAWQQGLPEAEYYISKLTLPGELVFDPFCGGGTTAVAAKRMGRRWLTCDIHEEHALIARGRIADTEEVRI